MKFSSHWAVYQHSLSAIAAQDLAAHIHNVCLMSVKVTQCPWVILRAGMKRGGEKVVVEGCIGAEADVEKLKQELEAMLEAV